MFWVYSSPETHPHVSILNKITLLLFFMYFKPDLNILLNIVSKFFFYGILCPLIVFSTFQIFLLLHCLWTLQYSICFRFDFFFQTLFEVLYFVFLFIIVLISFLLCIILSWLVFALSSFRLRCYLLRLWSVFASGLLRPCFILVTLNSLSLSLFFLLFPYTLNRLIFFC